MTEIQVQVGDEIEFLEDWVMYAPTRVGDRAVVDMLLSDPAGFRFTFLTGHPGRVISGWGCDSSLLGKSFKLVEASVGLPRIPVPMPKISDGKPSRVPVAPASHEATGAACVAHKPVPYYGLSSFKQYDYCSECGEKL